jgi:hypothetical protein
LLPVLAAVGLADIVAGFFWHRRAFSDNSLEGALQSAGAGNDAGLSEQEGRLAKLMPHVQTQLIIVWAFIEAAAIYGLVLVFIGHDFTVMLPFAAASLVGLLLLRPHPLEIIERAGKLLLRI